MAFQVVAGQNVVGAVAKPAAVEGPNSTKHKLLTMYSELPRGDITLEEFEKLALDRLRGKASLNFVVTARAVGPQHEHKEHAARLLHARSAEGRRRHQAAQPVRSGSRSKWPMDHACTDHNAAWADPLPWHQLAL